MSKHRQLLAIFALTLAVGFIVARHKAESANVDVEPVADQWHITGALSEACTCNVPCSCNFGEGPSPHPFCYAVYSYQIKEGAFNGVSLSGLCFGGMETARGNALYLDNRADGERREALEAVARKVMRVAGDRMGNSKLLGIKYVDIKQQYDDRGDSLELGNAGSFKTAYIMGRDKTRPVVVVNNTEWPIHEAIKGKTESFRINDSYGNSYSAKKTNSNHGDFEFDQNTRFGRISCAAGGDAPHKH